MKSLLILFIFAILGSQCQVHVLPVDYVVSILHGNALFLCLSTSGLISDVQWLLNGSVLQGNNLTDVTMSFTPGIGGTLTFMDLLAKYNDSTIRCTAGFSGAGDEHVQSIDATKLLIQGLLGEVGSLRVEVSSSNISLTWTAPFSLNISGVDHNIEHYCVNVSDSNSSQFRNCDITETEYNYSLFPSSCYTYCFVVYAVNLVGEGAPTNGSYAKNQTRPEVTNTTRLAHTLESEFFTYRITISTEVCGVNVTFVDRDTGAEAPFYVNETYLKLEDNIFITFTTEQLTPRRHYDIILEILKNNGSITRDQTSISTHGIMDVAPTNNNESVEISYYVSSDVSGALLNVVLLNGSSDIQSSFIMPLDRNTPLSSNWHPGHYKIYVYDIGYNGTLYNGVGYPAASTNATFGDPEDAVQSDAVQSQEQSSDIKCNVSSLSRVIKAECSNMMSTGLQVIAQLINISEIQNLYVNKSMDLQTPVMVQVDNDGEYQITIFPISEEMGILDYGVKYEEKVAVKRDSGTNSTPTLGPTLRLGLELLLGLVLGLGLGLLMAIVVVVVYYCKQKEKVKSNWQILGPSSHVQDTKDEKRVSEPETALM